jgi:adenosylcobinamide-phosphate synthase
VELVYIYLVALLLDLLIGDPNVSWHPVALIGRSALRLERFYRKYLGNDFFTGMICALTVILGTAMIAGFVVLIARIFGVLSQIIIAGFWVYITIAPRSLISHTRKVSQALKRRDLDAARHAVGMITSRDPEALDEAGVIRSTLETLGENVIDGITSALFWAMVGWLIAGVTGAAAGAMMYRAANTLDATFGYKNKRYRHFGTFAARLDDVLNFIPARLTLIAIFAGAFIIRLHPLNAVKYAWRDRHKHPSPNSNWGMAAFAGALGVQLGGTTHYRDKVKHYETWGEPLESLKLNHIIQAQRLVVIVTIIFSFMSVFIAIICR